jgi:heme-degrading monooxygenase HmoA
VNVADRRSVAQPRGVVYWRHLPTDAVPGFVEFYGSKVSKLRIIHFMLRTPWESRAVFEAWTKSEAFRAAHSRAGDNKPLYLDPRGRGKSELV